MDSPELTRFLDVVDLLAREPDVEAPTFAAPSKKFGADALKVDGRIFAMLARKRLVVKLPKKRVDELVETGHGERFDPGHGRVMKEWLSLAPDAPLDWRSLATEALEHVRPKR